MLADLLHVVDTHILNGPGLILEVLDIEVYHLKAQLLHVGDHVLRDLFCHALAVLDHFLQAHGAHDLPHVALQHLGHQAHQLLLALAQQALGGQLQELRVAADLHVGHAVHADVDELVGGDGVRGAHVHLHHPQGQLIHPLEEGDPPAGPSDEDALFAKAGDDVGRIRRRFQVAHNEQHNDDDDPDGNGERGHEIVQHFCYLLKYRCVWNGIALPANQREGAGYEKNEAFTRR